MGKSINQEKFKKKIQNLIDFTSPNIKVKRNPNPGKRNHPIYRCILGCSFMENSTSPHPWDVKLIKKEESNSLILERR
jgi:hypothetical protein